MPANSDNADNGKDGFMDRLAKTIFASPNSPFTSFADKQRIERLDQCQQLQLIVDACHAANSKDNVDDTSDIQTSRSGIRISRFYKWGSGEEQQDGASTDNSASDVFSEAASSFTEGGNTTNTPTQSTQQQKSNTSRARYSKGCAIETHELWACKALAVGCGNYLSDLRHCWSNNQQEQQKSMKKNEDGMTYHNGNTDKSCRTIQVDMARCVNTNKAELEERRKAVKEQ